MFSPENAYVVEQAQGIKNPEGSNEAIVTGEMAGTPPGSKSTACCSRDFPGTWEDLCLPPVRGYLEPRERGFEDEVQVVGSTHSTDEAG